MTHHPVLSGFAKGAIFNPVGQVSGLVRQTPDEKRKHPDQLSTPYERNRRYFIVGYSLLMEDDAGFPAPIFSAKELACWNRPRCMIWRPTDGACFRAFW